MKIDDKEVELKESLHPEAREEMRKRLSLVDAIKDEIKLMEEVGEYTKNPAEKTCANLIAYALHHILCRWVDGDKVELDRVQRRFYLVKEKP